jgi:hypothetical protein
MGLTKSTLSPGTFAGKPCFNFFATGAWKDGTPIAARGMAIQSGPNVIEVFAAGTTDHPVTEWDRFVNSLHLS